VSWRAALRKADEHLRWCMLLAERFVLRWWGVSLAEFRAPVPPSVMALYWAHECAVRHRVEGKVQFAPARYVLTNYPEVAPGNLTAKRGDDEVRRFGIHPYDIRSHAWACQQAFWEGVDYIDPRLRRYGFAPFVDLALYDQLCLLLLQRSVGLGCTRGIARKARLAFPDNSPRLVVSAMEAWLSRPAADTTPFDGAQTTATVRLRFVWCTRIVQRAADLGIGDLPLHLGHPLPRPEGLVDLPRDFHANMRRYRNEAKREGPAPTGPWPGG
jgi:hypothetical protein